MPPPKKKKNVHPCSIANLKGQSKVQESPEPDPPIVETITNDEETLPTNVHFDSTKPRWSEESDEDEDDDFETLVKEDEIWRGGKLVKDGLYAIIPDAAIEGRKCTYLGDNYDNPKDEDYLTGTERKAKERKEKEQKKASCKDINVTILI
jgi:hypothetical protein